MNKIYSFLFAILLIVNTTGKAQENQNAEVSIASPNSASLGKFVDVPVNYHIGIPQVDIPIYTITEGPLQMPISLSYHASGLKVMEHSSWVGAGWALNAGGVITRSVRGAADEKLSPSEGVSYLQDKGYYNYLYTLSGTGEQVLDYSNFASGAKDGEPDLFFFNFNGFSGKFYFRPTGEPVIVPEQDIKIQPLFCDDGIGCSTTNEYLYGWTFITPDGTKYHFGITKDNTTDTDPVEVSVPFSLNSGISYPDAISSWYLYKVESHDAKFEINLTYESERYSTYGVSLFPVIGPGSKTSGMDVVKNFITGIRLSNISFSNGSSVQFIPQTLPREDLSAHYGAPSQFHDIDNEEAKALQEIRISDGADCRSFEFSTSYFVDNTGTLNGNYGTGSPSLTSYNIHTDQKRLKLDLLTEKSCNGSNLAKPPYVFTYFDEGSVPRTLSLAQDHWGFFNGKTSNDGLVPELSVDGGYSYTEGVDRESSWPEMRAGSMQKIEYPTGGTTEFDFDHHRVWKQKDIKEFTQIKKLSTNGFAISEIHSFLVTGITKHKLEVRKTNLSDPGKGGWFRLDFINADGTKDDAKSFDGSINSLEKEVFIYELSPTTGGSTYEFYLIGNGPEIFHGIEGNLFSISEYVGFEESVVGGLRIDTLTQNPGNGASPIVQTFDYVSDEGQSYGALYSVPAYVALTRNYRIDQSGIATGVGSAEASNGCIDVGGTYGFFVSPGSILPMRTTQGRHFGYNAVKVSQPGNGYTLYSYELFGNSFGDVSQRVIDVSNCDFFAPNFPPAPLPHKFKRGELREIERFDESGKILQHQKFNTEYQQEPVGTNGLIVKPYNSFLLATEYESFTARRTKTTEENIQYFYDGTDVQTFTTITETHFDSENHQAPTAVKLYDGLNATAIEESRNVYNYDLVDSGVGLTSTCDGNLTTAVTQVEADYQTAKSACGGGITCLLDAWLAYVNSLNNTKIAYITCRDTYLSDYQTKFNNDLTVVGPDLKPMYRMQEKNILAPVETTSWTEGKILNGSYNDFEFDNGNENLIYLFDNYRVNLANPGTTFDEVNVSNGSIQKSLDYDPLPERSFNYENGQITEIIPKPDVPTSYIWGFDNTLPVAQILGASYDAAVATLPTGDLDLINGNTLSDTDLRAKIDIIRQALPDAQVTCYTYDPLVGMTSQTDPNGITTFYEYDALNRLKLIRDHEGNILQHYEYHYHNEGQGGVQ